MIGTQCPIILFLSSLKHSQISIDSCVACLDDAESDTGLKDGEYCEVYSRRDHGYLFGRIKEVPTNDLYVVSFPFGSQDDENIPQTAVRRARIYDTELQRWRYIDPTAGPEIISSVNEDPTLLPLVSELPETMKQPRKRKSKKDKDAKRKKRKKDKLAPKRAKSGYIVFLDRHREEVRNANPQYSMKDVVAILAGMWKNVSSQERDICEAEAHKDKERYRLEMESYEPPIFLPDEEKKDKDAPKKGRSGYILFSMDYRKKFTDANGKVNDPDTFTQVSKEIGEMWSTMSDEERKVWMGKSKIEQETYEIARKTYLEKKTREAKAQVQALAGRLAKGKGGIFALGEKSSPLTGIDMPEVQKGLATVAVDNAYYMVVDALRNVSEIKKEIESAATHYLIGRKKPEWKSFLIACFGFKEASQLLLPEQDENVEE